MRRGQFFIPPMWLMVVLTGVGIVGTRLVYGAIMNGTWQWGIAGALMMTAAMVMLGTPLAYATVLKKAARQNRH